MKTLLITSLKGISQFNFITTVALYVIVSNCLAGEVSSDSTKTEVYVGRCNIKSTNYADAYGLSPSACLKYVREVYDYDRLWYYKISDTVGQIRRSDGTQYAAWFYSETVTTYSCEDENYPYLSEDQLTCSSCEFGTVDGDDSQCASETVQPEDLNYAGENSCTNNPVNIATGNKFFEITDYITKQNPLLTISRSYDSGIGNWRFNIEKSLSFQSETNSYLAQFANGSKGTFVISATGWSRYENHFEDTLTQTDSGEVTYYTGRNHQITFNSSGQVIAERLGGFQVSYNYLENGDVVITDPVRSKSLTVSFNSLSKVSTVTLPNQKQIIYNYDQQGRLSSVDNQGIIESYFFENSALPNAITKVLDTSGKTYKEISYFTDGRVQSSALNGGVEVISFEYPATNITTTTNALGKRTTYHFTEIKGVKKISEVDGHESANCIAANKSYEYDENGLLKAKTDWRGNRVEYVYNERGLEIQRTEAAGTDEQRIISTTWHHSFNLPTSITISNQITSYEYNENGLLISHSISGL